MTFKVGTNLDVAQVQVQNRVAVAQPQLPAEVQQQGITVKKASPNITVAVALFSPDGSMTRCLSATTSRCRSRKIARLPGVGDTTSSAYATIPCAYGSIPTSWRPKHDRRRRIKAVKEQNVQVAAGIVGGPPLPAHTPLPIHAECAGPAHRARLSSATSSSRSAAMAA